MCGASTTTKDEKPKQPSLTTTEFALGFASFHLLFGVCVALPLLFVVGTYLFPSKVGLFVVLPYYSYVLLIGRQEMKNGGHNYPFSKSFVLFRIMRKYLNIQILSSDKKSTSITNKNDLSLSAMAKKDPSQNYIFALFPHGSNADFRILMDGMLHEILPEQTCSNTRTLAATILFRLPLVRELSLWTGCVDASRAVAERQLKQRNSVLVLPGGEDEQIRTEYGKEIVYLQKRKGFIKLALRHNVPVVPAYAFGVGDYYKTSLLMFHARLWLVKKLNICIPFAWGALFSPSCPRPVPTTIVFGQPIQFEAVKDPNHITADELNQAHSDFCQALTDLFNHHKDAAGYGDRQLEIV